MATRIIGMNGETVKVPGIYQSLCNTGTVKHKIGDKFFGCGHGGITYWILTERDS